MFVSVKFHRLLGDIHEFRYFPGILILSSSVQEKNKVIGDNLWNLLMLFEL